MQSNTDLKLYKALALLGIIVMGVGSFLSCLATTTTGVNVGIVLLLISLVMTITAFSKWQP